MSAENIDEINKNKKKISPKKVKLIKLFTILLWLSLVIKWFFFDYEGYIIQVFFSNYAWIDYLTIFKISIKILLLITIMIIVRSKMWILYILFYPIIFIFWKIPSFIVKHKYWFIAVAIINSIILFFSSFKYYIIIIPFYIISSIIIFKSANYYFVLSSIIILILIVFVQIIKKIWHEFKPSYVVKMFERMNQTKKKTIINFFKLDSELKQIPKSKYDDEQLKTWTDKLQTVVLTNRVIMLFADKFNEYKKTAYSIFSLIASVFILMVFVTISFSFINYGIHKIDDLAFTINLVSAPKMFNFVFYSFNALFHNSINDIIPKSILAQIVFMTEFIATILTSGILLSLLIPILNNKRKDELGLLASSLESKGTDLEEIIISDFDIKDIDSAIEELKKTKESFMKAITIIADFVSIKR